LSVPYFILMLKYIIVSLLSLCFAFTASAQTTNEYQRYRANIFYPEILGNGLLYSFNYERIKRQSEHEFFSIRVGIGFRPRYHSGIYEQTIPFELNWCQGKNHHLEAGIGLTTVIDDSYYAKQLFSFIPAPRIGYRYQTPEGHFVLRVGLAALFTVQYNNSSSPTLYPGLAIGYAL
jgi:hypothetical protein